jgi:hypothetical protein
MSKQTANEDWQLVLMNLSNKKPCCYTVDGRFSVQYEKPFFHLIEEVETQTYWVGVFMDKHGDLCSTRAYKYKHKETCHFIKSTDYRLIHETTFEA